MNMHADENSDGVIVCVGQRMNQEGSSPSGARMRSAVSKILALEAVDPNYPLTAFALHSSLMKFPVTA